MKRIYTIGETVFDIIFRGRDPVAARAGGSMLNTAVSLGRLGLPVDFISEYATDRAGEITDDFLAENAVNTGMVYRYSEGKTAVSLAFLNDSNDASYTFHKSYPAQRLRIALPDFNREDLVLFGAFYSLMPEVRPQLMQFVKAARNAGAGILYDPNIRSPHKDEIHALRELVYENISLAGIVRGSDEDFRTICDISDGPAAYKLIRSHGCNTLVYTKSNTGVEIHTPGGMMELPVPEVKTLSTIGAGDSFNAGLLYGIFNAGKRVEELSLNELSGIVETAITFGSHVCTQYDNYISRSFAEKILTM